MEISSHYICIFFSSRAFWEQMTIMPSGWTGLVFVSAAGRVWRELGWACCVRWARMVRRKRAQALASKGRSERVGSGESEEDGTLGVDEVGGARVIRWEWPLEPVGRRCSATTANESRTCICMANQLFDGPFSQPPGRRARSWPLGFFPQRRKRLAQPSMSPLFAQPRQAVFQLRDSRALRHVPKRPLSQAAGKGRYILVIPMPALSSRLFPRSMTAPCCWPGACTSPYQMLNHRPPACLCLVPSCFFFLFASRRHLQSLPSFLFLFLS
ncbi:uncharacterized protein K452DRAFT_101411 [Aplosporella prunicola CBS 121167]|uniref:Uncharacterized protein n=1 Tax=Aplosporella prunicola CBS 121167 TaxID=1176127 RepID=A0A6A6B2M3_9PEZI|nr:uncharacterized protein K452DRAFT_101411 [Aplosporella prunicola CBS 121167]KAF2137474.1 hypothetical protein K452DRAFT_101411 [Aplosporella prunicola CBS 121167]